MALRTINSDSWMLKNSLIIQRRWSACKLSVSDYTFKGPKGAYYTITEAPSTLPHTTTLQADPQIRVISFDRSGKQGVWEIGNVFCKVSYKSPRDRGVPEHTVIDWLNRHKWSFPIPKVVYYATDKETRDVKLLFMTQVPGETLQSQWPMLTNFEKRFYAGQVAKIHREFAQRLTSDKMGGIDGRLSRHYVQLARNPGNSFPSYDEILRNSKMRDMACDEFHFYHFDLHIGNVMIRTDAAARAMVTRAEHDVMYEPGEPMVGVIDFEDTGFVPYDWISVHAVNEDTWFPSDTVEFKRRLKKRFEGFGMRTES